MRSVTKHYSWVERRNGGGCNRERKWRWRRGGRAGERATVRARRPGDHLSITGGRRPRRLLREWDGARDRLPPKLAKLLIIHCRLKNVCYKFPSRRARKQLLPNCYCCITSWLHHELVASRAVVGYAGLSWSNLRSGATGDRGGRMRR